MSHKISGAPYSPLQYTYKPKLNGGLYTGQPFLENAPWRNFPNEPSTGSLINNNLRSANPPNQAMFHYPSANHRLGNNEPDLPGIIECNGFYVIQDDQDNKAFSDHKDCFCQWKPIKQC
jgi:hypothetical protein